MRGQQHYDGDLQMFVQAPRDLDTERLRFLRWLAERGRLEHEVAGPAGGPLAELTHLRTMREAALAA
jgi:hypothetical protein